MDCNGDELNAPPSYSSPVNDKVGAHSKQEAIRNELALKWDLFLPNIKNTLERVNRSRAEVELWE